MVSRVKPQTNDMNLRNQEKKGLVKKKGKKAALGSRVKDLKASDRTHRGEKDERNLIENEDSEGFEKDTYWGNSKASDHERQKTGTQEEKRFHFPKTRQESSSKETGQEKPFRYIKNREDGGEGAEILGCLRIRPMEEGRI